MLAVLSASGRHAMFPSIVVRKEHPCLPFEVEHSRRQGMAIANVQLWQIGRRSLLVDDH